MQRVRFAMRAVWLALARQRSTQSATLPRRRARLQDVNGYKALQLAWPAEKHSKLADDGQL